MMEEEKNELLSIQNTFFNPIKTWMEQHKDKTFTLEGKPQNLVDKTILESFKHIILNTSNVTTVTELSYNAEMAIMEEGVPEASLCLLAQLTLIIKLLDYMTMGQNVHSQKQLTGYQVMLSTMRKQVCLFIISNETIIT